MKKYSVEDQRLLASWAADCVERVLPLFENPYPNDFRPRAAIETCRLWVKTGEFKMSVIRRASLDSHAAAREVKYYLPAFNAARAAGHAAAVAHVSQHAFGVYYALRSIAAAFPDEAQKKATQEYEWQSAHIPQHLREEYLKRVLIEKRSRGLFIYLKKDSDF